MVSARSRSGSLVPARTRQQRRLSGSQRTHARGVLTVLACNSRTEVAWDVVRSPIRSPSSPYPPSAPRSTPTLVILIPRAASNCPRSNGPSDRRTDLEHFATAGGILDFRTSAKVEGIEPTKIAERRWCVGDGAARRGARRVGTTDIGGSAAGHDPRKSRELGACPEPNNFTGLARTMMVGQRPANAMSPALGRKPGFRACSMVCVRPTAYGP
jgi:hypothetical protein